MLIRRCRICEITNDMIEFMTQRSARNGKVYTHNICLPCRKDYNYDHKYNKTSREEFVKKAMKWNQDNRERYNKRRRKKSWLFNNCIDNFYSTEVV